MSGAADQIEGRLDIRLRLSAGMVADVAITSSRPLQTPRIFVGKTVEQLLATLPLLYSVCGTAQACAAVTACEQAMGMAQSATQQWARSQLVWLETAKEHLWRVLLDWPALLGEAPAAEGVGELIRLVRRFQLARYPDGRPFLPGAQPVSDSGLNEALVREFEQLLQDRVYGQAPARWLELDSSEGLIRWAHEGTSPAARMLQFILAREWSAVGRGSICPLPWLEPSLLRQRLEQSDAAQFVSAPQWQGQCRETSPFTRARRHPLVAALEAKEGPGLLARFCARLVELAGIPAKLRQGEAGDADTEVEPASTVQSGIGQVEAARGRLVHRVILDNGKIAQYQILAPTEWNFHPAGVLSEGLNGLRAESVGALREQAVLLINAIDPCVGYELHIEQG